MKIKNILGVLIVLFITTTSCKPQTQKETTVEITTEYGTIKLKLYNETPKHRDNFINLVKKGYFNDKIFHRVIKNFMIQGGMASTAPSANTIPESDIAYTIPAEFNQSLFHKKGALAGARKSDMVNPNKETTASQFYIVQGEIFTETKLKSIEENINNQNTQLLARKYYLEKVKEAQLKKATYNEDEIAKNAIAKAQEEINKAPYKFSQNQIKTYTTVGGTPHLDGSYTVFGEVIEGLDVVDKIANVKTLPDDKPEKEIKFSIKIME
jgi:peptidylprolyl isomerase